MAWHGCCRWLQPFKLILSQTKVQQKRTNKTKTITRKRIKITTSRRIDHTLHEPCELRNCILFCVWFRRCMLRYQKKRWQLWLPQCFWLVWVFPCGSIWTKSKRWSGGKGTEIIIHPPLENATNKEAPWLYDPNESDVGWLAIGFWSVPEILPHFFFPFLKFSCSSRREDFKTSKASHIFFAMKNIVIGLLRVRKLHLWP